MSDSNSDAGTAGASTFAGPARWLLLAAAAIAATVYYPLFFPETHHTVAAQSEEFFFEANESAGLPVLVLAAWLFYRRSHYLDVFRSGGEPLLAGAIHAPTLAHFAWEHFTGATDLQLATVIPLGFGLVIALGGRPAAKTFWVPIVFLGFALPLPPVPLAEAIFPVQLLTADYAGMVLNFIGVKSLVQGDQILRPQNTFIVIETCSGVRTIVTLSMLSVLMIDLFERRGRHALLLMLLAPIVAFLANGLRVVTLVLNPHSSIHEIHNLQGILMLLVGLTMIYVLDLGLERLFDGRESEEAPADYGSVASRTRRGGVGGAALVLASVLGMLVAGRAISPYVPQGGIDEMPKVLLERVYADSPGREVKPNFDFRGSIRYLVHHDRELRFEGERLGVFLGVANERIRTHTVLSPRLAWHQSGWVLVEDERVDLDDDARGVRRVLLERGGKRVITYSWYLRAGSLAEEWWRQALALDRSPFEREEHILAVRFSAPIPRGEAGLREAEDRIRRAWKRLAPELEGYAPLVAGS